MFKISLWKKQMLTFVSEEDGNIDVLCQCHYSLIQPSILSVAPSCSQSHKGSMFSWQMTSAVQRKWTNGQPSSSASKLAAFIFFKFKKYYSIIQAFHDKNFWHELKEHTSLGVKQQQLTLVLTDTLGRLQTAQAYFWTRHILVCAARLNQPPFHRYLSCHANLLQSSSETAALSLSSLFLLLYFPLHHHSVFRWHCKCEWGMGGKADSHFPKCSWSPRVHTTYWNRIRMHHCKVLLESPVNIGEQLEKPTEYCQGRGGRKFSGNKNITLLFPAFWDEEFNLYIWSTLTYWILFVGSFIQEARHMNIIQPIHKFSHWQTHKQNPKSYSVFK